MRRRRFGSLLFASSMVAYSRKGSPMSTLKQYRARAAEYSRLVKTANSHNEVREFQRLERSFAVLADNEQWLSDNHDKTVHAAQKERLKRLPIILKHSPHA